LAHDLLLLTRANGASKRKRRFTHISKTAFFIRQLQLWDRSPGCLADLLGYFKSEEDVDDIDSFGKLSHPLLEKGAMRGNTEGMTAWLHRTVSRGEILGSALGRYWSQVLLEAKHEFVQVFSENNPEYNPEFKSMRDLFRKKVYQELYSPTSYLEVYHTHGPCWYSFHEIATLNNTEKPNPLNKGFFFHATSKLALEAILKTGLIEVRHERAYKGAFVSTKPETGFGSCILALAKKIERLSPILKGFRVGGSSSQSYWAGFSEGIPVNEKTLAYIMVNEMDEENRRSLQLSVNQWTGRKIKVIHFDQKIRRRLEHIAELKMGIPVEWPDAEEDVGNQILNAMKAVAMIAQANEETKVQPLVEEKIALQWVLSILRGR